MVRSDDGAIDDDGPFPRFTEFYQSNAPRLMQYMLLKGASWEEAEDAVEEAMLDLWQRWRQVADRTIEHPYPYVRKAAERIFFKTRGRDKERNSRSFLARELSPVDADAAVMRYDEKEWVRCLLELLPPAQRKVMALTLDGLNGKEIAELLGKNPAAVRKNLQLARGRLAGMVHEERSQGEQRPPGWRHPDA